MHINDFHMVGLAGQYLTCCDLILKGLVAYPVAEGLPYDLVIDGISRFLRVQVKTTWKSVVAKNESSANKSYVFNFQHGRGKYKKGSYQEDEADIFALVALDIRKVGYVKATDANSSLRFRSDACKGNYQSDVAWRQRESVLKLMEEGVSREEICNRLGLSDSTVYNYLRNDFKVADSSHRYFSSIEREPDWFWEIINAKK
jgi:DNA-binding CsgD family transcriptional regulator